MGAPHSNKSKYATIIITTGLMLVGHPVLVQAADPDNKNIEQVIVYGEQGLSDTATKLGLTLFETPQTVTAISRMQMDDFSLNTVNRVLDYTPGVTVENVELDRTYYTARGFDIVNFLYDGVGLPFFSGLNRGQPDTALYDKIEVVKGAAGLITGVANPSATINFVRKRPTEALQASATLLVNEWNGYRLDGDISGSLTDKIRGRLVVATEDTESYLDRHELSSDLFYGIVEADLSSSTQLTLSHSIDESESDGTLWGALPLTYTDGTQVEHDVSTSSAAKWAFSDNKETRTLVELKQALNEQWSLNAVYTRVETESDSELLYLYGALNRDETQTALAPSAFQGDEESETDIYDAFVSGSFNLFEREHQLVAGYSHIKNDIDVVGASDRDELTVVGADWAEGNSVRPTVFESVSGGVRERTLKSIYISTRLNVSDRLSVLLGARKVDYEQSGIYYGADQALDADEIVPYYGATFKLTDSLMAYGSYSEAFTPQGFVNASFSPLGAAEGTNSEIGLKKSFDDGSAVLTLALFQAEHNNLGEFVERVSGVAIYQPRDYESEGFEVEISGELFDGLNVGAGYTQVDIEDFNGDNNRPFVPKKLLKISASYRIPILSGLKVGGVLKWQGDITSAAGMAKQEGYTLLDLTAHYDVTSHVSVGLLVENISDEKYLNSLYWAQAYYGAPRNVKATVSWKY